MPHQPPQRDRQQKERSTLPRDKGMNGPHIALPTPEEDKADRGDQREDERPQYIGQTLPT